MCENESLLSEQIHAVTRNTNPTNSNRFKNYGKKTLITGRKVDKPKCFPALRTNYS